jgi:hypothetical protein
MPSILLPQTNCMFASFSRSESPVLLTYWYVFNKETEGWIIRWTPRVRGLSMFKQDGVATNF